MGKQKRIACYFQKYQQLKCQNYQQDIFWHGAAHMDLPSDIDTF